MNTVIKLKQSEVKDFMPDDELKKRWLESDRKDINRARLFWEARNRGRSKEEIAEVLDLKERYVYYLLEFGGFLTWCDEYCTMVQNPDFMLHEVKERTFRKFWQKRKDLLGKTRHRAVLEDLIDHQREQSRHDSTRYIELAKSLKENGCVNGRKFKVKTLADRIGYPIDFVQDYLEGHRSRKIAPAHGIQIEQVSALNKTYKLHPASGKKVDPTVILSRIQPYLDELEKYGKMFVGSHKIVPSSLLEIAHMIRKTLTDM